MSNQTEVALGEVTLTNVRLAFPDLFVPTAMKEDQVKQYGAVFLVQKGSKNDQAIRAAIQEVAEAKWGKKAERNVEMAQESNNTNCYQDGDSAKKRDYDGYAGHMALTTKNKKRPTVVDRDRTPLTEDDNKPYAGCYVVAKVSIWAQDNQHGVAIRATLLGVQFYKDGDAFGAGRTAAAEEFPDLSAEDDDENMPLA